jgi:ribosomal protein S18 acetylase RimI-like enzyme
MAEVLQTRRLGSKDQPEALEYLRGSPAENLVLIDFVARLDGTLGPGEVLPQVFGAYGGGELAGVAALRPSLALSSGMSEAALEAMLPYFARIPSGLLKSDRNLVAPVWKVLEASGRRSVIDRIEVAYRLDPEAMVAAAADLPGVARPARSEDLEELVHAARASLWEEDRPDPADGDPLGFRRWVEGRLHRARVVSERGRTVFVAYADVRRTEGWLVQGVYTWPEVRRRGFARRGMDSVVREAFASGASHVQLAVVEGNERASALYEHLGFEAFGELRTILFH